MRVFVPLEDAAFDAEVGLLVPYRCGLTCVRGLRDEAPLDGAAGRPREPLSDGSGVRRPASDPTGARGRC